MAKTVNFGFFIAGKFKRGETEAKDVGNKPVSNRYAMTALFIAAAAPIRGESIAFLLFSDI